MNIKENEDELKVADISTIESTNSQYICKEWLKSKSETTLSVYRKAINPFVLFCKPAYHTVTYIEWHTRGRIDTIDSPDDEHLVPRNM